MARDRNGGRPATDPPRQQAASPPANERGNNKPAYEVRLGRVKAAVWANQGDNGVWYSVVISRLYKDGNEWKRAESFGRDDLPLVMKVADLVHTWIYEQQGSGDQAA